MSIKQVSTEELGWQSIDNLLQELGEVIVKHSEVVDVEDIEKYIRPQLTTIYRHAMERRNNVLLRKLP